MTSFPTLDARPDQKLFSEKMDNPAMSAKAEGGYEFSRPRFTRRPRRIFTSGYTNVGSADKQRLVDFWNQVKGGSDAFLWPHPASDEIILVRFSGGKTLDFSYSHYAMDAEGGDDHRWNTAAFELKEV
jgi:hypothetical protein